jgi:hypothetical protein
MDYFRVKLRQLIKLSKEDLYVGWESGEKQKAFRKQHVKLSKKHLSKKDLYVGWESGEAFRFREAKGLESSI